MRPGRNWDSIYCDVFYVLCILLFYVIYLIFVISFIKIISRNVRCELQCNYEWWLVNQLITLNNVMVMNLNNYHQIKRGNQQFMINASSKHPLPIPLQVLLLQPCQSGTTCIYILYLVFYRYACTALAFGQTGSGKTHTMTGPPQQVLGIMG